MNPAAADLAVASAHYHAGRFGQASDAFRTYCSASSSASSSFASVAQGASGRKRKLLVESSPDFSSSTAATTTGAGDSSIFSALPSLSVEADAALSAARSVMARTDGPSTRSTSASANDTNNQGSRIIVRSPAELIQSALEANSRYQAALLSASLALRRSEATAGTGRMAASCGYITNVNRRQVAIAFLMAGTSASWLHMATSDVGSAESVMLGTLMSAASCFWDDGTTTTTITTTSNNGGGCGDVLPPTMLPMSIGEAFYLLQRGLGLGGPAFDAAGGETMDANTGACDVEDDCRRAVEVERCRHASRMFCNALRVVQLGGGRIDVPGITCGVNGNGMGGSSNEKEADEGGGSKDLVGGDAGLRSQELLTWALVTHQGLATASPPDAERGAIMKKRDDLIERAASLEAAEGYSSLGLARKVQILLDGLKLLSSCTKEEDTRKITISNTIASLKNLSSSSRTAHAILGCIHASRGDHALAIDSWQKALTMDEQRGNVGSRDYRGTFDNLINSICPMLKTDFTMTFH